MKLTIKVEDSTDGKGVQLFVDGDDGNPIEVSEGDEAELEDVTTIEVHELGVEDPEEASAAAEAASPETGDGKQT